MSDEKPKDARKEPAGAGPREEVHPGPRKAGAIESRAPADSAPGGRRPYDCLVIHKSTLGKAAVEARKAGGGTPGSEPEAFLHAEMFRVVLNRYGHLLGLGGGDISRLHARQIMAGPYAMHDLFTTDPEATINFRKDHVRSGECRYEMTRLRDGSFVGRLKEDLPEGEDELPAPEPAGDDWEDPAIQRRRRELMRVRDGRNERREANDAR